MVPAGSFAHKESRSSGQSGRHQSSLTSPLYFGTLLGPARSETTVHESHQSSTSPAASRHPLPEARRERESEWARLGPGIRRAD